MSSVLKCTKRIGSAHIFEEFALHRSSSSLGGSILLILGYGYLLLKGAGLLSDGSEALLEVLDPGIIGGAQIHIRLLLVVNP